MYATIRGRAQSVPKRNTLPARKYAKKKEVRPCALCFGPLEETEIHIHDKHRGTKLADEYLASLDVPKLKPAPPKISKKKGGRPKGSTGTRVKSWLSPVEQELVDLLCEGYKSNDIARISGRNRASVATALARAQRRTGAKSLYELVTMNVTRKLNGKDSHNGEHWRGRKAGDQEDRTVGASESSEASSTSTRTGASSGA